MAHRFFIVLFSCTLFIHSINADSFQAKHTKLNSNNLLESLRHEFKNPYYRKEILPNNFSYFSELIKIGSSTNHSPTYLRSVIKLFSNMLKSSEYVNAYAFSDLIEAFPTALQPYFVLNITRGYVPHQSLYDADMFDRFRATVNNVLLVKFSSEYDSFKKDPAQFLEHISGEIVNIVQEEVTREQLRQELIRFFEIALSKLIWNVSEQDKTWNITKKITDQLATLLEFNILDDANDLDDLYWTLLNRYCYFIQITATDMNESFFKTIKKDIASNKLVLFEIDEQDYIVETKLSYLQRSLIEAEAQSRAYNYGLNRS